MKQFYKLFALTAMLLAGIVTDGSAATLVYDFRTNHPSGTMRIDNGHAEVRGTKTYWVGEWAGLFGNKIAFDVPAYVSLVGSGGLCDYHDHQKMYVMNLSPGDKVTFFYSGVNAALQYHVSSTASVSGLLANFDPVESGTQYTVTRAGDLCVINKWKNEETITVIYSIVIETATDTETVDVSHGLSTYCSKNPLDFSNNTNLKAYIATNYSDGKFIFKQVDYVPSQTGFLIEYQGGSATEATVNIGRSENYKDNAISGNLFTGCLTASNIPQLANKANYIFAVADGNVGIYKMSGTFTCAAGKAYMTVNK